MAGVDITNTGKRPGKEVAQLCVHDIELKIDAPVRELEGFVKVALRPGQTKNSAISSDPA